jgi:hypothetical protein
VPEARASLEVCRDIAELLRQPVLGWLEAYNRSALELLAGDPDHAEQLALLAYERARPAEPDEAFAIVSAQLFAIRRHQGRLDDLVGIAGNISDRQGSASFVAGLALILAESGKQDDALQLLEQVAAGGFEHPLTMVDLTTLMLWSEIAFQLGAASVAPALLERLTPYVDQVAADGTNVAGSVAHAVGTLHALRDDGLAAREHYATAMRIHEAMAAPFWIATTAAAWAEVADDPEAARSLRERAAALAEQHGYAGIGRRHQERS